MHTVQSSSTGWPVTCKRNTTANEATTTTNKRRLGRGVALFKPVAANYILRLLATRLVGAYETNGLARYNLFESYSCLLSVVC